MSESVLNAICGQKTVSGVVRYEDPFYFKTVVLTPEAHTQLLAEMGAVKRQVIRNRDGRVMLDGTVVKIEGT